MNIRNIVYLFAVGFFSILGQVVILRELNVAFYGIELIYILSFAFWLAGTAIGAASGRRSFFPGEKNINTLFLTAAIVLIADIIFIRSIRILFSGVPGGFLPFFTQVTGLIIALLPVGFLAGLLFQWTAKKYISGNETLAKAYAIESGGGVLGGLCSTVFLNSGISNFSIALICSACFALIVVHFSVRSRDVLMIYSSTAASVIILFVLFFSSQIDMVLTSWNHPYLLESADTPYNRITITSPEGQICIFEDDALSYETQSVAAEEFVQLSTLQSDQYDNVLVLGGGFGGIITELLKLPVKKIDYVEINRGLIEILRRHLPAELNKSFNDQRVHIIYNDPRKYLRNQNSYDIILTGMPEPMSAQNNRFYTKEFFEQCSSVLKGNGILAFKIHSSENIWPQQLIERNAGIYNALRTSFENIIVLPGVENIFIASKSELTEDVKILVNRFKERNQHTRLISPQYISYIFTNDRYSEIQRLLSGRTQNINSDFNPVCFSYTISIWLSKFFPNMIYSGKIFQQVSGPASTILIVIIIIFFLVTIILKKKFAGPRRFILVFIAGFTGMILEIILILFYQTKEGILFNNIGLLLMAFMVGLSLGSYIISKIKKIKNRKLPGRLLFIGFALLNLIIYFFLKLDLMSSLPLVSGALLINGMFVSGIFAFTGLYQVENQQGIVKQLYTADLIGGCTGSLFASLILIPLYGFYFSLAMIIILMLGCLFYI